MKIFYNTCFFIAAILTIIALSKEYEILTIKALVCCVLCRIAIIETHIEEINKKL